MSAFPTGSELQNEFFSLHMYEYYYKGNFIQAKTFFFLQRDISQLGWV
jgi:hypothetical protein